MHTNTESIDRGSVSSSPQPALRKYTHESEPADWQWVEDLLGIASKVEKRLLQPQKGRGVFICSDSVWKVNFITPKTQSLEGFQSLRHEATILNLLFHTGRVPRVFRFLDLGHIEALSIQRINGVPLDECRFTFLKFLYIQFDAIRAIHQFARLGIVHGDLAPYNIFLGSSGNLRFIDFGHAYKTGYLRAVFRSLFIKNIRHPGFNRPYLVTLVRLIEFALPQSFRYIYRKALRINEYPFNR